MCVYLDNYKSFLLLLMLQYIVNILSTFRTSAMHSSWAQCNETRFKYLSKLTVEMFAALLSRRRGLPSEQSNEEQLKASKLFVSFPPLHVINLRLN